MFRQKTIGILALQGAFDLHCRVLSRLNVPYRLVKTLSDLRKVEALVLPGGESTTMRWFFQTEGMIEDMARFVREKPVMGTCAGMILLARRVADDLVNHGFDAIDIDVRRNAYGRQVHSHIAEGQVDLGNGPFPFSMVFIRAPRVERVGTEVQILGSCNGEPTMVANKNVLAISFHPELSGSDQIHRFFIEYFVDESAKETVFGNPQTHHVFVAEH